MNNQRRCRRQFSLVASLVILVQLSTQAVRCFASETPEPAEPRIAAASAEAEAALQSFRLAPGLTGSLFAAEPLVANPVALFVDSRGRVFVCESFRQGKGVTDNRNHPTEWVDADLASQTVEDRRAYHIKHLGEAVNDYTEQDDRIRLLLDTDRDGVADESHMFADHFNGLVEGTGAGVLEHRGDVYYTCIPNLWRIRDHDGDHQADSREVLHTGYGVRVAFRGHDLHGLRMGPDGRLYFSLGDRGANVETPDGRVKNTESGSVFRCELDGSNLEIYATGLRNPQELAFDDYGNLFTGDNNSDSGDRARWVYVAEGGDSGWRMAYQYLSDRGPFNREKLWHPFHEAQPAYIVPPVANISDGPSGLDYYPGTGFGDDFKGRFFLCDFRGTPSQSGVRSFRVEPDGAFFKLVDDDQPIWSVLATDLQFGPDGSLYVCDWVNGWEGEGKGRIYRFVSPEHQGTPVVDEVRDLLADNFQEFSTDRLVGLITHVDQRVRLKAQYELASRRETDALQEIAKSGSDLLARLHAVWGLEQVARADGSSRPVVRQLLLDLLNDKASEIRAHATRLLGEIGGPGLAPPIIQRLSDENARVRYFAAMSLAKLAATESFDDVVELLENNDNRDPILRHGGVLALSRIASDQKVRSLSSHASVAVRLAAVVALRRKQSPEVATFLNDENPLVVVEAARAIHDEPIPDAIPALAALVKRDSEDEATLRRVLNANFRLGSPEHAQNLAQFAARSEMPATMRLEAIEMLGEWQNPGSRDRVLGMWRPLPSRDSGPAAEALRPVVAQMTMSDSGIRLAFARVAGELGIAEAAPVLTSLVGDTSVRSNQRADALRALAKMTGKESLEQIRAAVADDSVIVRAAGFEVLPKYDPAGAAPLLAKAALEGETLERQAAIVSLGQMASPEADKVLVQLMQQLANHELAPEVHLETLTAARSRDAAELRSLVEDYTAKLDPSRPLDQYREAMFGGDSARGRQIFYERTSVSCVRCHKVFFRGGEVGPDLSQIAVDKDREYLLEAIVDPNKTIAKGFESVMVLDENGKTHVGVLKEESDEAITLMDADAKSITIPKSSVELRKPSQSAMPSDVSKLLSKADVRDLVEYLASLTGRRRFRGFNRVQ